MWFQWKWGYITVIEKFIDELQGEVEIYENRSKEDF